MKLTLRGLQTWLHQCTLLNTVVTTEGYLLINEDEPVDQNCQDGMSKRMLDGNKLCFGKSFINVTLWEDMIDFVLDKKNAGTH